MPTLSAGPIVITRPVQQAHALAALLEKSGRKTIIFPTLEILPLKNTAARNFSNYSIAIFVSANAVHHAFSADSSLNSSTCVIAIGPGTAQALRSHSLHVQAMPLAYHSEGILALDLLQKINGQKIAIFCGENSRPLLKNTLLSRGATVDEIICYQRRCPDVRTTNVLKHWQKENVSCIISTSAESLANLWQLLGGIHLELLLNIPLIVISPAMALQAKHYGFQTVIIATGANDQAILNVVREVGD